MFYILFFLYVKDDVKMFIVQVKIINEQNKYVYKYFVLVDIKVNNILIIDDSKVLNIIVILFCLWK